MPSIMENNCIGEDGEDGDGVEDQSPIEQVSLIAPVTDDLSLPVMMFHMWTLVFLSCISLMIINTFFAYRT
jgi:hypothetical protein